MVFAVMSGARWVVNGANGYLAGTSPLIVAGGAILAWKAFEQLSRLRDEGERERLWQALARRLIRIEPFKSALNQKIEAQFAKAAHSIREKWAPFGDPVVEIPDEGWACIALMRLIDKYSEITLKGLKDRHFSGTIYQAGSIAKQGSSAEADDVPRELEALFTHAFQSAFLWNTLHTAEFPAASFLEYQTVQMVGALFGGKNSTGIVTSGGTESLMTAAKAYRNWGIERGIAPGECVIIAPDSIHAALPKACADYQIRLVLVPTDETGAVDMALMKEAVGKHKSNLVALYGSAPSFAKGKIDPIEAMGALAFDSGVGFHVDCCLGGFVINFKDDISAEFLKRVGVTSLSADTHKNGWAPKGSSVLIGKRVPDGRNLLFYSAYAIPGWTGGVYGTAKSAGSQSCLPAFHAFLAMMSIGRQGYQQLAEGILKSAKGMAQIVKSVPGLKVLGEPDLNVVAFQVDPELGLMSGASYAFAAAMSERGFVLNALKGDAVHFCITGRFIDDPQGLQKFEQAARESMEAVQKQNAALVQRGEKFPGEAGLYGELEAALEPKREAQGWRKYLENRLFGEIGVSAVVKAHVTASLNPVKEKPVFALSVPASGDHEE